jgi:hypothetical protein
MATKKKNAISHKERKNPHSLEDYRARKHAQNAARGKQMYDFERKGWVR